MKNGQKPIKPYIRLLHRGINRRITLLTSLADFINMGNKRDSFDKLGVLAKPDGIDKMSTALFTGLIGIVLLCALLPVFISQIAGLGANTVLASWSGLAGFQTIAYIIPTVFIIGLIILLVRFFSSSRE